MNLNRRYDYTSPLEALRDRGWVQGTEEDILSGKVCSIGAINAVYPGRYSSSNLAAMQQLANVIRAEYQDHCDAALGALANRQDGDVIVFFNDDIDRTFDEVERVFVKAFGEVA